MQHHVAPAKHISQIKLPRRAKSAPLLLLAHLSANHLIKLDHFGETLGVDLIVHAAHYEEQIGVRHLINVDFRESIEKRLGQALATAALHVRVLTREYFRLIRVDEKLFVELADEDLAAMVETRVEALQHGLRRQVYLVQDDPAALLEARQKWTVAPLEALRVGGHTCRRQISAKQLAQVRLLAQIDAN